MSTQWKYSTLPELIPAHVPHFVQSQEYVSLVEEGVDDLPGVFLGRYGEYLIRISTDEDVPPEMITKAFDVIEQLIATGDRDLRDAVVNEIFEVRDEKSDALRAFYTRLGPAARSLYDESCKPVG